MLLFVMAVHKLLMHVLHSNDVKETEFFPIMEKFSGWDLNRDLTAHTDWCNWGIHNHLCSTYIHYRGLWCWWLCGGHRSVVVHWELKWGAIGSISFFHNPLLSCMCAEHTTLGLHLRGEFFVLQINSTMTTMMRITRTTPTSPPITPPAKAPALGKDVPPPLGGPVVGGVIVWRGDWVGVWVGVSDGSWVAAWDDAAVESERH